MIADGFDKATEPAYARTDPRKDFMPVKRMRDNPFAGAHVCWTCARTPAKIDGGILHREGDATHRTFCDTVCQRVFHGRQGDREEL